MTRLKRLIHEVHRRSLWQVLAIYAGASWVVFEIVQTLTEGLGLPDWFPAFAFVLLLIGLPIVLATAFVQEGGPVLSEREQADARGRDVPREVAVRDRDVAGEPSRRERGLRHFLTWRKALLGGLLAFALWGVIATGWLLLADRGRAERQVAISAAAPDSESVHVAVLPFEVTGPDMDLWREGMVQLLSSNLDGLAGIRRADPQAILSHWRSLQDEAGISGSSLAVRVARRVGADVAVTGRAVASGTALRLSAEVHDVDSDEVLARVQVEGAPDSILALADRLTLDLIGTAQLTKGVQLASVRSSGLRDVPLSALRHFLDGQRDYYRGSYTAAIEDYEKAIEEDSTFALAYYGLSRAYGWLEGFSPRVERFSGLALRHGARLPERLAGLLRMRAEANREEVEAIRSAQQFTTRFPEEVEGWYRLGDAYVHIGHRALEPVSKMRAPFQRALDLDPSLGDTYIHMVQEAFLQGDRGRARDLIDAFAAVSPESPYRGAFEIAYALVWDDTLSLEEGRELLRAADVRDLRFVWNAFYPSPAYRHYLVEVGQALTEPQRTVVDRRIGADALYEGYRRQGRIREAREAWELARVLQGNADVQKEMARLDLRLYVWGYAGGEAGRRAREVLGADLTPHDHFYVAALAADEGDWPVVRRHLDSLETMVRSSDEAPSPGAGREARGVAPAIRVYEAVGRGDLEEGLQQFRQPMPYLDDDTHAVLRYRLGVALLRLGRADEAERYFISLADNIRRGPFKTLSQYELGRTYEALNEPEKARLHYGRFVNWWENCDSHLRPLWERGREALARLTKESA